MLLLLMLVLSLNHVAVSSRQGVLRSSSSRPVKRLHSPHYSPDSLDGARCHSFARRIPDKMPPPGQNATGQKCRAENMPSMVYDRELFKIPRRLSAEMLCKYALTSSHN